MYLHSQNTNLDLERKKMVVKKNPTIDIFIIIHGSKKKKCKYKIFPEQGTNNKNPCPLMAWVLPTGLVITMI